MAGGTVEVLACVVGHEYAFEPMPTDVEIGPDGWLYVSSFPGGPEDPSLGARGAIFRINPLDLHNTPAGGEYPEPHRPSQCPTAGMSTQPRRSATRL